MDKTIQVAKYEIKVADQTLSDALLVDLIECVIDQQLDRTSSCNLRFRDPGSRHLDSDPFPFASTLKVKLGTGKTLSQVFEGEVTAFCSEFTTQGDQLVVRALDRSHRLRHATRRRMVNDMTDADLIVQLAKEHGISATTESTASPQKKRVQIDQNNESLMHHATYRTGRLRRRQGTQLDCLEPPYEDSGTSIYCDRELYSFDLRADVESLPTHVEVRGWDVEQNSAITASASAAELRWKPEGSRSASTLAKRVGGESSWIISDLSPKNADEAAHIARAMLESSHSNFIHGVITGGALYTLRPGTFIALDELVDGWSGRYLVRGVTHLLLPEGITTRAYLSRNSM